MMSFQFIQISILMLAAMNQDLLLTNLYKVSFIMMSLDNVINTLSLVEAFRPNPFLYVKGITSVFVTKEQHSFLIAQL